MAAVRANGGGAGHRATGAPAPTKLRGIQRHPIVYGVLIAYAVVSTVFMLVHAVGVTSDHALLIVLVLLAIFAPARAFVWDFLPFIAVAVMFSDVGTMVEKHTQAAHTMAPILMERAILGGNVAAVWLQQHVRVAFPWLDVPLAIVYLTFFAAPLVTGIWLWFRHRAHFSRFVTAYIVMMAVGFLIHVIYPETPPWLAARDGLLPSVDRITVSLLNSLGGIGRSYAGADPAPYGAMPALHVAVPSLIAATVIGIRGWRPGRAWWWLLYPATMAFATMYLGEHYLVDTLAGMALGFIAYAAVRTWSNHLKRTQMPRSPRDSEFARAA